jgi:hypothetical protein
MYYFNSTGGYTDSVFATMTAQGINYGTTDIDPNLEDEIHNYTGYVSITATLVPEPASLGLLAAGSLLMLRRRRVR